MKPYIIIGDLPACSAVLFVKGGEVTILCEHTREFCLAYAAGYRAASGLAEVEHRGSIILPAGNPALSYAQRLDSGDSNAK